MKFTATIVNLVKDETEVLCIGLLENESYNNYVTIQYSDDFDEQDLSLNWSKYYLDISNSGGCYSCITNINVTKYSLTIALNENGVKQFKTNQIIVSYFLDDKEYANFLKGIKTIFEEDETVDLKISD